MRNKRVMLVDDDLTIIETLEYNLKRNGFDPVSFNNGQTALAGFDQTAPDLVILDWSLPDMVGPDICKLLRLRRSDVPILMLTGRANPNDVAHGLSSGADDYLSKPFSFVELLARVQALMRRTSKQGGQQQAPPRVLTVGELSLDESSRRVSKGGVEIEVSPKEFALLKFLMLNANKVLSTEEILNQVWGADFAGDVKTVAVHVRWLRQKIESDPKRPQLLETVHRSGYRLNKLEKHVEI